MGGGLAALACRPLGDQRLCFAFAFDAEWAGFARKVENRDQANRRSNFMPVVAPDGVQRAFQGWGQDGINFNG